MGGDAAARWRALEACRDYLQLVVRRGRWSNQGGRSATSDLIQETIMGAWRNFSRFQGRTPAQLRAWLRAILVHASLNARRRPHEARIESGGAPEMSPARRPRPARPPTGTPREAALDAALAGLPERIAHGRPPAALGPTVLRRDRRRAGRLGRRRADALWAGAGEAPRIDEARP